MGVSGRTETLIEWQGERKFFPYGYKFLEEEQQALIVIM